MRRDRWQRACGSPLLESPVMGPDSSRPRGPEEEAPRTSGSRSAGSDRFRRLRALTRLGATPTARRASLNLLDQVVSAGTNAALAFIVANSVNETSFGGFAVALTIFGVAIGLSRAVATSPLGIRFSSASTSEYRSASAAALGTAIAMGAIGGVAAMVAGAVVGGVAGQALLAVGVMLPALLAQDAWRQVFIAAGKPGAAVVNDTAWAVVQLVAVGGLLILGAPSVGALILSWGGAALAASLLGVRQGGTWPQVGQVHAWVRDHRDLTGFVAAEFATLQLFQQGALLVIAAIGSLQAVGALRGAQVLLGPISIIAVAAFGFAVPELARRRAQLSPGQWMQLALALSGVVALLGLIWGVIFLLAPNSLGESLLGDTWPGTRDILVPSLIGQVAGAAGVGFAAALYAMDRAPVTMYVHVPQALLLFAGGVGGVLLNGASGAAWGFAIAFCAVIPIWVVCVLREAAATSRRYTVPAPGEAAAETPEP